MTYKLRFVPAALKEWERLAAPIKSQFKKKLAQRLETPRVLADKLRNYDSVYKIKLRTAGYRLVYEVIDDELVVYVLAVGKREKGKVYTSLKNRAL
ncbi:type II toxin-antitoxin system RelE family toxin [Aliidiomarina sanyensis]|uniref:Type II toxin-antitoxin system mRNA interferase toxin, RelE/StbE family n=1 Tax=Aliidiomarina sanyensis TaxID=1249555 RepID=A0A432WGH9_9GAMM|nr:type II toxin-antitoxin system RelE/ParE family toxin [Aliidiomarina sanyensis]RUO32884.1 type II toxin-antitoxin system mRNA interferase toxin, RelE/StbE family [Aliidiomarina sanyensis]